MSDQKPGHVFFYHRVATTADGASNASRRQADRIADWAESRGLHPSIGMDIPEEAETGSAGSGELPPGTYPGG